VLLNGPFSPLLQNNQAYAVAHTNAPHLVPSASYFTFSEKTEFERFREFDLKVPKKYFQLFYLRVGTCPFLPSDWMVLNF
jgi:hypothetical protein